MSHSVVLIALYAGATIAMLLTVALNVSFLHPTYRTIMNFLLGAALGGSIGMSITFATFCGK